MSTSPTSRADEPLTQAERLRRDLQDSQAAVAHVRRLLGSNADAGRLLGLVTAARTSELYLPYTLPLILRQAEAAGLGVDLVLGMNNGYECPALIDSLTATPGLSVIRLTTTPKPSLHAAGVVVDPDGQTVHLIGAPERPHRLFVVHQVAGPWSAGKDVMLLDLIDGLIVPNLERGWHAPAASFVLDAEAVFVEHEPDATLAPAALADARGWLQRHEGQPVKAAVAMAAHAGMPPRPDPRFDIGSNGFGRLLAEWRDSALDALGPATRFCPFGAARQFRGVPVLMPLPLEPIAAVHRVYNEGCGILPGCSCLSGAATLARTDVLIGMLSMILQRYPDIYAEDAIFTVLAEQAGLRLRLTRHVQFTNRCAARSEIDNAGQPAWMTQITKWYRGFDQVEQLYGAEACASVLGPGTGEFLTAAVAIAAAHLAGDRPGTMAFLQDVAESGPAFEHIRRAVVAMRDVA